MYHVEFEVNQFHLIFLCWLWSTFWLGNAASSLLPPPSLSLMFDRHTCCMSDLRNGILLDIKECIPFKDGKKKLWLVKDLFACHHCKEFRVDVFTYHFMLHVIVHHAQLPGVSVVSNCPCIERTRCGI